MLRPGGLLGALVALAEDRLSDAAEGLAPLVDDVAHGRFFAAVQARLREQGIVLVSGPWGPDEAPGALLIFRGDSADAVRELTVDDPFRTVGAVTDVRVQEWIPVLGPLAGGF